MPTKDLHDKPFDDSTIAKLEIFEDYVEAWVPTFVMLHQDTICIFDFFAGTGYDKNGVPGSPIRILGVIKKFVGIIFQQRTKVKVFLNEFKKDKFEALKDSCSKYLQEHKEVGRAIEINYCNEEFDRCFDQWFPLIERYPCLVFLDQNGIKYLSRKYLLALEKTTRTDFLYFVSSSYFLRFGDSDEFKKHFFFDLEEAKKNPYSFIHRILLKQLRAILPSSSELKLYPFTLKKGSNFHGIVFGAKSPRAVEKFLTIAWKRNETNGEANFDIDEDEKKNQLNFFSTKQLTKIEGFHQSIEEKLKSSQQSTNAEMFMFTLNMGHPPKHAADHLRVLKKRKVIHYEGLSPKITFDALIDKRNSQVLIKWIAR